MSEVKEHHESAVSSNLRKVEVEVATSSEKLKCKRLKLGVDEQTTTAPR